MFTRAWIKGMAERAIKTAAQALLSALGVYAVGATGVFDVDWLAALSAALMTTVLSILTSIGNADFVAGGTPLPADGVVIEEPDDEDPSVIDNLETDQAPLYVEPDDEVGGDLDEDR